MGGAVSTGRNNDDLVDNLVSADYIRTPAVQKLFRAVDRADYFLPQCKKNAYKDLAWKSGNLHLSAPCIYSEVVEGLQLKPNLSFLNLGSGTGYLSTMVGLAIGSGGINHGVELYADVIDYAIRKLDEFKRYSSAIDEYELCEPKFVQGNCLCLSSSTLQYDRVYCGGACPPAHIDYMKNLIKVGGILVMPVEDQLMQIERTSETSWEERCLLPVSFATLIHPEEGSLEFVTLMDVEPSSLQEICRTVIRNVLRNNIDLEFPELKLLRKRKGISKKKHTLKRAVISHLDTSDEGSEGEEVHAGRDRSERSSGSIHSRSIGAFIDIVLGRIPDARPSHSNSNNSISSNEPNASSDNVESDNKTEHNETSSNPDSASDTNPQDSDVKKCNSTQTTMPKSDTRTRMDTVEEPEAAQEAEPVDADSVIARIMIRKRNRVGGLEDDSEDSKEGINTENTNSTTSNKTKTEVPTAAKSKREKFDSGLGDEIASTSSDGDTSHQVDDQNNEMDVDPNSSSDEDEGKDSLREEDSRPSALYHLRGRHWRTVTVPSYAVDHLLGHMDDETPDDDHEVVTPPPQPVIGPYTIHMRNKIQELPLPQTLKNYLNYYKEL